MPELSKSRNGLTPVTLLIAVVILGVFATVALPRVAESKARRRASAMKGELLNLAAAEHSYFVGSGRYADLPTLVKATGYRSDTGVSVQRLRIGAHDWAATVTYRERSGTMCGIGVNTPNPLDASARDGEPVCSTP